MHRFCLGEVSQHLPASCGNGAYNRYAVLLPSALPIFICIAAFPETAALFERLFPASAHFATRNMTDVVIFVIIMRAMPTL